MSQELTKTCSIDFFMNLINKDISLVKGAKSILDFKEGNKFIFPIDVNPVYYFVPEILAIKVEKEVVNIETLFIICDTLDKIKMISGFSSTGIGVLKNELISLYGYPQINIETTISDIPYANRHFWVVNSSLEILLKGNMNDGVSNVVIFSTDVEDYLGEWSIGYVQTNR